MNILSKFRRASLDTKIKYAILAVITLVVAVAYILTCLRRDYGCDGGYYLGCVNLIAEGYVPYRDFYCAYTPLSFYMMLPVRLLVSGQSRYAVFLGLQYVVSIVNALFVALIVRKLTARRDMAYASALFYCMFFLYNEQTVIMLEGWSSLWGLAAMVLVLCGNDRKVWRMLLAGALCAGAFLAKQYGLVFAGAAGVALLAEVDRPLAKRLASSIWLVVGFVAVVAITVALFIMSGTDVKELYSSVIGSGYGASNHFHSYISGVVILLKALPVLLFVPILLQGRRSETAIVAACLSGVALATLQFFFAPFPHYNIFAAPFGIVLAVQMWTMVMNQNKSRYAKMAYVILVAIAVGFPMRRLAKVDVNYMCENPRAECQAITSALRQTKQRYGLETAFADWSALPYYAEVPFHPACMKKYGYSFGGGDTPQNILERLEATDCFLHSASDPNITPEVKNYFETHFTQVESGCTVGVYVRNEILEDIEQ